MKSRLGNHRGTETYVIFDRHEGISAKDHERQRRAGDGSTRYQLTLNSPLPGRDAIMKHKDNKRQLAQLLCAHELGSNIELVSRTNSIARHDEADISLISYMLHAASMGAQTVRILSDDTDVFVLLIYWSWKAEITCRVQMEKWDGSVLDINATVTKLGEKCQRILAMHALSGCDTVSYPHGKGKVSALKVLNQTDITGLDSVMGEDDATDSDLVSTGRAFFAHLYGQKKTTSMNTARYEIYRKRKNPPSLKTLPPTDSNLALHIKRAHLQMLLWKAADKPDPPVVEITNYGWEVSANDEVMPCLSKEPAAPENLMDVISCSCRAVGNACSKKCGCSSSGLSCTSYCVCEGGDECFNALTQREGLEEGSDEQDEGDDLESRIGDNDLEDEDSY